MSKKNPYSDRLKYDMDQALSMKGQSQRTLYKKSSTSAYGDTRNKVNASLKGLDTAEDLAKKGKLKEAQSAYELNIGNLINILNELKSSDQLASYIGINKDVLKERTKAALTDAEKIKEKIKQGNEGKLQSKVQTSSLRTPRNSLFNLGKSKSTKTIQTKQANESLPIPTSKSEEAAYSTSYQQKVSSQPKKKSNLNYRSNDPFITTIKNDIYVDSSTLTTTWTDISGLVDAKRALQEAAILPLLRPDLYTGLRSPPKGILLYGPPGTGKNCNSLHVLKRYSPHHFDNISIFEGKTMLVKAVAHESKCILFACSASAMTSKWVGEGEKLIRTLFRMASDVAPSIVFLDEMDSLLGRRKSDGNSEAESSRRFKTEFMVQMDGIAAGSGSEDTLKRTLLIGATNCPWDIDDAVMRRFQRRVYVPLPDKYARLTLWKKMVSESKGGITISPREVNELVKLTDGFSCSDISSTANEASFGPLRDLGDIEAIKGVKTADVRLIHFKDFKLAISSTKKSVSKELLKRYEEWEEAQSIRG